MAISRAQLAKELEPGLNALFGIEYDRYEAEHAEIYDTESSDRAFEEEVMLVGFGNAQTKAEGAGVNFDNASEAYTARYTHETIALAFALTEEAMEDNLYDRLGARYTRALARSMAHTKQVKAAATLNNAFNSAFSGGDGKELCATDHPLIGGGTAQNELTTPADLSVTSLRQALNDMEDTVDERGLLINVVPEYLLVPNELIWDAEELLKSSLRPDTANNPINAFQVKNLDYMVWNYLTDADARFLVANKMDHNMKFYEREPVNVSSDYDFEADASKTKIRCRFSNGWSDWRGVFGSPGAA